MEEPHDKQNSSDGKNGDQPIGKPMRPVTLVALCIIAFILIIALWRLYLGDHIADDAKRTEVWVQSILSTAILIVVAVQACIYFRQAKALDRQVRHAERQTKISREQLKIASHSLVIAHKAWVGVHSIETDRTKWWVFIKIENIGHVPARDITVDIDLIASSDLDSSNTIRGLGETTKYPLLKKHYGTTELFPGNLQIMESVHLMEYLTVAELEHNEASLFLSGFITYWDGFKGQPQQRTDFFFRYHPDENFWAVESPRAWLMTFGIFDVKQGRRREEYQE